MCLLSPQDSIPALHLRAIQHAFLVRLIEPAHRAGSFLGFLYQRKEKGAGYWTSK